MPIQTISKTVIAMGEGDVLTGTAIDQHGVGHFVFMIAGETKSPGTPVPEFDGKFTIDAADVLIMFKDAAAVDRVIATMTSLRNAMESSGRRAGQ
ncbi:hypothetical protein [Pseudomonas viridiflava]|uniref:hypothetical protein n=1 Tax=Pseudomonas viridiflava TaxID=33069 RepID=UPI001C314BFF|nr:hypothetical protein [Pseudomonas viridiflava]QXG49193.1 hypothetical protein KTT57_09325 [Pseudomonas viridiflava]